jgi:peptidoglycan/xylan/chitin deacetylase (PgdA/CDA1 family)
MNHPSLITLTLANVAKEFNDVRAQFTANTCIDPTLYRPPFGDTNANVQALAQKIGQRGIVYVAERYSRYPTSACTDTAL